jgi:FO synthase
MHAVARLVLHPLIPNIQASWVKLGPEGAAAALRAGANDLGGILMDESITRAAGGQNGQLFGVEQMRALASSVGRPLRQRTTLYGTVEAQAAETMGADHVRQY